MVIILLISSKLLVRVVVVPRVPAVFRVLQLPLPRRLVLFVLVRLSTQLHLRLHWRAIARAGGGEWRLVRVVRIFEFLPFPRRLVLFVLVWLSPQLLLRLLLVVRLWTHTGKISPQDGGGLEQFLDQGDGELELLKLSWVTVIILVVPRVIRPSADDDDADM
jgi:hypothetical protein